jgi:predicted MPP superfamily phosphohydrolase
MKMYRFIDPPDIRREKRLIWATTRSVLETLGSVNKRSGRKSKSRWDLFLQLLKVFTFFLRLVGYYRKGYGNAKTIKITELELHYENLPPAFDGFTILHLSDLHLDSLPGFASIIIRKVKTLRFDLCLLTGDYRKDISGSFSNILKPMKILSKFIQAPFGTFAVLGNHDTYLMAQYEKDSGIELLINESVEIVKDDQKILITGTDDPFNYYSEQALISLETTGFNFKIAMVHTPELAVHASKNRYDLYLCGHTHGGQICLKEGFPLVSHQFEGKQYNQGKWHIGKMTGYTSRGVGVSGIPIRFNCPAEIIRITLKKLVSW